MALVGYEHLRRGVVGMALQKQPLGLLLRQVEVSGPATIGQGEVADLLVSMLFQLLELPLYRVNLGIGVHPE